jgi:hypothetical protein
MDISHQVSLCFATSCLWRYLPESCGGWIRNNWNSAGDAQCLQCMGCFVQYHPVTVTSKAYISVLWFSFWVQKALNQQRFIDRCRPCTVMLLSKTMKDWCKQFCQVWQSMADMPQPGPTCVTTKAGNITAVEAAIWQDQCVSTKTTAADLSTSLATVHSVIHNLLYYKVCCQTLLSAEQKSKQMGLSLQQM